MKVLEILANVLNFVGIVGLFDIYLFKDSWAYCKGEIDLFGHVISRGKNTARNYFRGQKIFAPLSVLCILLGNFILLILSIIT